VKRKVVYLATALAMAITCAAGVFTVYPVRAADTSDVSMIARGRIAIEETLSRSVRALDDSDLSAYPEAMTDEARFISEEGTYSGKGRYGTMSSLS
jgi:hypothetical protein